MIPFHHKTDCFTNQLKSMQSRQEPWYINAENESLIKKYPIDILY